MGYCTHESRLVLRSAEIQPLIPRFVRFSLFDARRNSNLRPPFYTLTHTRPCLWTLPSRARTQKTHRFTTFAVCAYTFRSPLRARIDVCLHIAGIATGVDLLCAREGKNNNVE